MCYSEAETGIQGGIRCNSDQHAEKLRKDAVKAEQAFQEDPNDETEEARRLARLKWYSTPSGMRSLEAKGKHELAEKFRRRRERQLEQAREFRARNKKPSKAGTTVEDKLRMASDPETSQEEQLKLARQKNQKVLLTLAKHSQHSQVLRELALVDDAKVSNVAMHNPQLGTEALRSVFTVASASKDETRLRMIAHHPNCPADLYKDLVGVASGDIASKEDCPSDILFSLSQSKWRHARKEVAANRSIDIRSQEVLAGDTDANIRYTLAGNPSTSTAVLERIRDTDPEFHPRNKAEEVLSQRLAGACI